MNKLQKTRQIRNYLTRREQWRLMTLVLGLGVVILLMMEVHKPRNWQWLTVLFEQSEKAPDAEAPPPDKRRPPPEQDVPGSFLAPAADAPQPKKKQPQPAEVKENLLETVRDDTFFRPDESDAWFHLFAILKDTDEPTLEKDSVGRVSFAQLYNLSDEYRGKLVTIYGTVRRAFPMTAPRNDYAIEQFYRVWLTPSDNPDTPMIVYCLQPPEGFPTGMSLSEEVHVTGFFFKRWAYLAQGAMYTTPVVLAKTLNWQKRAELVTHPTVDARFLTIVFSVAAVMAVLAAIFVYMKTKSSPAPPDDGAPLNMWRDED